MRSLFAFLLSAPVAVVALVGCGGGDSGRLPRYLGPEGAEGSGGPNPTVDDTTVTIEAPPGVDVAPYTDENPLPNEPSRFRDISQYVFTDRSGVQWLSQTLLKFSGVVKHTRYCPIHPTHGILWGSCDPWTHSQVAHTGVGIQVAGQDLNRIDR